MPNATNVMVYVKVEVEGSASPFAVIHFHRSGQVSALPASSLRDAFALIDATVAQYGSGVTHVGRLAGTGYRLVLE